MKRTTYQVPELRDENDNIIQQGAFGKNTALANSTNDGWIDYVANDLEALHDAQTAAGNAITTGTLTVTGDVDITKNLSVSGAITGNVTGNVTGNADTATNATNDSNGDKIDTTYMPIAGGTFTGVVNGVTPAAGDNSTKIATTEFVNAKASAAAPTGVVQAFAGSTTPQGWLLCDGSAVSRTDYAALFAVIGTTYGKGNGSTTFNLPNLVDKFVEGSATAGTVKSAGLPNITGSFQTRYPWGAAASAASGAFASPPTTGDATYIQGTGNEKVNYNTVSFSANKSNSIYGKSTTVQPPALTMRYIIKY